MINDDTPAEKRRHDLKLMKEMAVNSKDGRTKDDSEEEGLTEFLTSLKTKDEERKHRLALLKKLFDNPLKLNFDNEVIPCSSTPEEIAERRKELQYRIDILKAVLAMTEGEMLLLSKTTTPADEAAEASAQVVQ